MPLKKIIVISIFIILAFLMALSIVFIGDHINTYNVTKEEATVEKTTENYDDKTEEISERENAESIIVEEEKTETIQEQNDNKVLTPEAEDSTSYDDKIDLSSIPEFSGEPYIEINGNIPFFNEDDKNNTDAFETYSDLDSFGRCGVAYANVCKELLPTEERGEIGDVRPSGWHTVKYNDLIDGNYLYNRCHLIAYRLAGENSNEKNLITGTRYLNIVGMLSFESMVGEYVEHSDNHVLYRVTPIFEGNNLVASGVEMEGWSVEDGGKSICFNVYCYNVQPLIDIDYATGESCESDLSNTVIDLSANTDNEITTDTTETNREITENNNNDIQADYIVNTNTGKIHLPTCSSVYDMAERNKMYYTGSLEELMEKGYVPCKRCIDQ